MILMKSESSVKAVLKTDKGTESIWVDLIPRSENAVVDNIPFEVFGLSLGDIVRVESMNGIYSVVGIVSKSGNLTFRVAKKGSTEDFMRLLENLRELKCDLETNNLSSVASINVSKGIELEKIEDILKQGEKTGVWEYEEGDVWCKFNDC